MFNPQVAQRENGRVTLYLNKKYPAPPVPFELQGHISADDWAIRIPALTNLASKYYKPTFERVWLVLAIVITLIIPLATYQPIFNIIYRNTNNNASKGIGARLIGMAIFLAALALFYAPIYIWKFIGQRRVKALLTRYSSADAARSPVTGFVPKWCINTPGVFTTQTILTITTPPVDPMSSFHPDAYLPAYIGKAEEAQGAYFYPYPPAAAHEGGLPRMSVVGGGYAAPTYAEKV
ncbi:hypothetical protein M422DRAFT_24570 [Sphaerobolus stellatus SS14]|nr:hypothetical protein M422DRAFT_24570 [Sphaerobolus stellatus SS14]